MKTKFQLFTAMSLCAAALVGTENLAHAQKGGRARPAPAVGRVTPAPAVGRVTPAPGRVYPPYTNNYYRNAGIGLGIGVGGPGYGYYGRVYTYDPNLVPRYAFYPNTSPNPQPMISSTAAQIRVLVPDPQAKVWFDGNPTTSTGTERIFHTPDLTADSGNIYRIRAAWTVKGQEMIQEEVVEVAPGRITVLDFTRPVPDEGPK